MAGEPRRQRASLTSSSQTLERLVVNPEVGQTYRATRGKLIQRVLMKKTLCHVYYFHDRESDVVEVHTIWGAHRERGPMLQR